MPVRKIPKNYRHVTGIAAETKAIGEAQFESPLERDFIALLEFSPEVIQYEVQPVKIEWRDGEGTHRYYRPDVRVEFREELDRRPWLCEVKCRADIKNNWDELHPRFRQGIRYARRQGWLFHLVSEVEIRTPYLDNARFLLPYRRRAVSEESIADIFRALDGLDTATPERVLQVLSDDPWQQAEWTPTIWHLVAHWRIETNLDRPLSMTSPISRAI
ncbi:MAG: TnsA endonuclease N-terminal domain-containing protein [Betaproteobacteria bacterium]|nr:TnsA endonuclease N-terminal domain-containing protein [Betaproteobacteria bacterium]